jgi:DNA primase
LEVWGKTIVASVQDVIDVLKIELSANGIELLRDARRSGDNLMVTCPYHAEGQERKPSMGISLSDVYRYGKHYPEGTCNCFTCGTVVDLPKLISHCLGYEDGGMHGYRWLLRNFMAISIEERKPLELNFDRKKKKQVEDEVQYVDDSILEEYRRTHPYVYQRKLTDKVVEYFDIGFDRESNAITIPVHDLQGRVVGIQRRTVVGKNFANDSGFDKGRYLYGLYQVYKNLSWIRELYITEAPIDALYLWTFRIPAIATMGVRITEAQLKLIEQIPIRKIITAFDNDEAGDFAREKIKKKIRSKLLYRLVFPKDRKDVNDMTHEEVENRVIEFL